MAPLSRWPLLVVEMPVQVIILAAILARLGGTTVHWHTVYDILTGRLRYILLVLASVVWVCIYTCNGLTAGWVAY